MNVLVLGYGSIGHRHAANALALGHRVGVFDPAGVAGELPGSDTFGALSDALDWPFGAVIIASPASTHANLYAKLPPHVPVLIEKPLARSVSEWRCQGRDEAPSDRAFAGYNLRCHPALRRLRKEVQRGCVGRVSTALFSIQCDKAAWPGAAYEDMLLEASHEIDLALWILGDASVKGASGAGDRWTLLLEHVSGVQTTVVLDGTYAGYRRGCEIAGRDGVVSWAWSNIGGAWRWRASGPGFGLGEYGETTPDGTHREELLRFIGAADRVRVSQPARYGLCTLQEGLDVLAICDEARRRAPL